MDGVISMSNVFGSRLRQLRKDRRLTMKEFGTKFDLAESTISGYETGIRNPDMTYIKRFAEFFDVTTDYLIGTSDQIPIDNIGQEDQNSSHKGDTEQIDPEWQELYAKVMEKGAKLEATAFLRAVADGKMSKKKLEALLMAFDFIEKDDD